MNIEELKQQLKDKTSKELARERIKATKSIPKTCDSVDFSFTKGFNPSQQTKTEELNEVKEIEVEVVANMAMFIDSDYDVLSETAWERTVKDRGVGNIIPFLKNHQHSTDGIIGKTIEFTTGKVNLTSLGYEGVEGTALIHKARVMKEFDEQTFHRYVSGVIKQHSIGLQYVKMELAVNDEGYEEEYVVWKENIDKIINKGKAIKAGYFWYVTEIKLIENSAVLFGANSLTPTLSVSTLANNEGAKPKNKKKGFYKSLITRVNE